MTHTILAQSGHTMAVTRVVPNGPIAALEHSEAFTTFYEVCNFEPGAASS